MRRTHGRAGAHFPWWRFAFVAWVTLAWPSFAVPKDAEAAVNHPTGSAPGGSGDFAGRPWTPRDSVATRYFDPETIKVSPNGAYFFFVTVHGDLSCDCEVWELTVYATEEVRRALRQMTAASRASSVRPWRTLQRRSGGGTYTFAIWEPTWEPDGESISFEDASEKGGQQLYAFRVRSGVLAALTHNAYELDSIQHRGDTIISNLLIPVPDAAPGYPAHAITIPELQYMMRPAGAARRTTTFVSYRGSSPWEIKNSDYYAPLLWFSPDGRRAVTLRVPKELPASWATYEELQRLSEYGRGSVTDFPGFALIDAEHRQSEPLLDAPTGLATGVGQQEERRGVYEQAFWGTDQRNVILVNTALPIGPGRDPERASMSYIVGYNVDSGHWKEIEPLVSQQPSGASRIVTQAGWLTPGKEFLVRHSVAGQPADGTVYTLKGDRWVGRTVAAAVKLPGPPKPPALAGGLSVTLRQSANDPPVVVASDGRRQLAISAPDPALEGIWRARQEPFQWREPSGRLETGGLLLPRERDAGIKLPLVIQAYQYSADEFNPDGMSHHAYAAQALVARGMAVLNVDIPAVGVPPLELGTPRELTEFSDRITSAAEALAKRGLIDLARVGLVGFSRGGFNTYYAITHPGQNPPAAAVMDDAFSGTYNTYLDAEAISTLGRVAYEPLYGGDFWHHKATWLEREASFNIDHLKTPTLFTIHSRAALPHAEATIGLFQLNDRPLEYLLFPMATHQLHMPRQRLASYEATVDWMAFWLQGYEDPSPEKAGQYARWRKTRAEWDKTQANEKAAAQRPPP